MKHLMVIAAGLLVAGIALLGIRPSDAALFKSSWITLFDGKNLDAWEGDGSANFQIVLGSIMAIDKKDPTLAVSNLMSKQSFKDFELRAEFWVSPDANSGIYIRCTDSKKASSKSAYEVNIFDTRPDPGYGTGAIVNVAKAATVVKTGGKWNNYIIVAKGSKFDVTLDGTKTVVGAEDSKFAEGRIALQFGVGAVLFRNVQIKPL